MKAMMSLLDQTWRFDLAESTVPPLRVSDLPALPADLALGYGTPAGDASLRKLIAQRNGVDPDQVIVTVGAVEAMSLVAQVVGGRVLLVTPCFPPARSVPESLGLGVDTVPLSFDEGYRMRSLVDAVGPATRLVSLASPQNPAGVRFTEEELGAVLAAAPDAVVLVDETYRESTYGSAEPLPSVAAMSSRVVTCSSLSKAYGAAGLRLGWLTCTDAALYEELRAAKFRTTIASSTVDQAFGAAVLRDGPLIRAPRALLLRAALDELIAWASSSGVEIVPPDAGALCCLRMPVDPGFEGRLAALETRLAPGSWFGEQDGVFRLGFGHLSPADFTEALARVARALAG
jgi:aspartate/methionine/tyrosine aminotransferase